MSKITEKSNSQLTKSTKVQKPIEESKTIKVEDVDAILKKIFSTKEGVDTKFTEEEIKFVCTKARQHFLSQSILLKLTSPIKVVGDIHGQFTDLLKIFKKNGFPEEDNKYLFLGDYVDRGKQSIETIMLLFCYMLKLPNCLFLLRGNHQSAEINKQYGFYDQCKRRYSIKVWKYFVDSFNCMPVCALIEQKILCMHGGLSPQMSKVKKIESLHRPTEIPPSGLLCDLLWSDPVEDKKGWTENKQRGISKLFGPDVLQKFLQMNDLDLICRGHQVKYFLMKIVQQGYEFFAKKQLVTIFSAPNYCGQFENHGAVLNIGKQLVCSFTMIKAQLKMQSDPKKKKIMPKYIN